MEAIVEAPFAEARFTDLTLCQIGGERVAPLLMPKMRRPLVPMGGLA